MSKSSGLESVQIQDTCGSADVSKSLPRLPKSRLRSAAFSIFTHQHGAFHWNLCRHPSSPTQDMVAPSLWSRPHLCINLGTVFATRNQHPANERIFRSHSPVSRVCIQSANDHCHNVYEAMTTIPLSQSTQSQTRRMHVNKKSGFFILMQASTHPIPCLSPPSLCRTPPPPCAVNNQFGPPSHQSKRAQGRYSCPRHDLPNMNAQKMI
jgi:hypothetical protein